MEEEEESKFWTAMQDEEEAIAHQQQRHHLLAQQRISSSSSSGGGGCGDGGGWGGANNSTPPSSSSESGSSSGGGVLAGLHDLVRAAAGSAGEVVHTSKSSSSGSRANPRRPLPRSSASHMELHAPASAHDAFHYRRLPEERGGQDAERRINIEDGDEEEEEEEEEEEDDDDEDRAGWAPVANLDVFFQAMYKYYQNKGFHSILAAGATNLMSMAFTVALSTWLFAYVDWGRLTTCHDEDSCLPFKEYLHGRGMWRYGLVWVYCLLFVLYWGVSCYWFLLTLKDAAEMKQVYTERLGISNEELEAMEWHEVVSRFLGKQRSGEYRVSIHGNITAKDIACRIMRRENFLIALMSRRVLDLSLPRPAVVVSAAMAAAAGGRGVDRRGGGVGERVVDDGDKGGGSGKRRERRPQDEFLTRNLEWSLHVCVLNDMFNEKFTLRRDFLIDEAGLRRKFVLVGLVQLALMPFLLVFMVMQFFLQNAQEWQQKKNYLGPRQWSPLARWRFREYNELPHLFERRLRASYSSALLYARQTPKPVLAVLARCVAYISGSVVAVLLLFTLLDESILLYVRVWDRNLLWYVGVFSAFFALSRSLIPGPEEEAYGNQEVTMERVAAHTHYFPGRWRGRCSTQEVRAEFSSLFQYKTALFQQEILSVVVTPLILCLSLPECAGDILSFLKTHHQTVEGLGSVCAFSLFDLEKYGSHRYGGIEKERGGGEEGQEDGGDGKVEKSLLNFCVNYPEWQAGEQGRGLLRRLAIFQEREVWGEEGGKQEVVVAKEVRRSEEVQPQQPKQPQHHQQQHHHHQQQRQLNESLYYDPAHSPQQREQGLVAPPSAFPPSQHPVSLAPSLFLPPALPSPPPSSSLYYRPPLPPALPLAHRGGGGMERGMGGSWGQTSGSWGMGGSVYGVGSGVMGGGRGGWGGGGMGGGTGMQTDEMERSFFWLERYAERFREMRKKEEGKGGGMRERREGMVVMEEGRRKGGVRWRGQPQEQERQELQEQQEQQHSVGYQPPALSRLTGL